MNFLKRLFNWGETAQRPRLQVFQPEDKLDTDKEKRVVQEPVFVVPEVLDPNGVYLIIATQVEMYDLGNTDEFDHFIVLDCGGNSAADFSGMVNPLPLLSATQPVEILLSEGVDTMKKLLFGEIKIDLRSNGIPNIVGFRAAQLDESAATAVRSQLTALSTAHAALSASEVGWREMLKDKTTGVELLKAAKSLRR